MTHNLVIQALSTIVTADRASTVIHALYDLQNLVLPAHLHITHLSHQKHHKIDQNKMIDPTSKLIDLDLSSSTPPHQNNSLLTHPELFQKHHSTLKTYLPHLLEHIILVSTAQFPLLGQHTHILYLLYIFIAVTHTTAHARIDVVMQLLQFCLTHNHHLSHPQRAHFITENQNTGSEKSSQITENAYLYGNYVSQLPQTRLEYELTIILPSNPQNIENLTKNVRKSYICDDISGISSFPPISSHFGTIIHQNSPYSIILFLLERNLSVKSIISALSDLEASSAPSVHAHPTQNQALSTPHTAFLNNLCGIIDKLCNLLLVPPQFIPNSLNLQGFSSVCQSLMILMPQNHSTTDQSYVDGKLDPSQSLQQFLAWSHQSQSQPASLYSDLSSSYQQYRIETNQNEDKNEKRVGQIGEISTKSFKIRENIQISQNIPIYMSHTDLFTQSMSPHINNILNIHQKIPSCSKTENNPVYTISAADSWLLLPDITGNDNILSNITTNTVENNHILFHKLFQPTPSISLGFVLTTITHALVGCLSSFCSKIDEKVGNFESSFQTDQNNGNFQNKYYTQFYYTALLGWWTHKMTKLSHLPLVFPILYTYVIKDVFNKMELSIYNECNEESLLKNNQNNDNIIPFFTQFFSFSLPTLPCLSTAYFDHSTSEFVTSAVSTSISIALQIALRGSIHFSDFSPSVIENNRIFRCLLEFFQLFLLGSVCSAPMTPIEYESFFPQSIFLQKNDNTNGDVLGYIYPIGIHTPTNQILSQSELKWTWPTIYLPLSLYTSLKVYQDIHFSDNDRNLKKSRENDQNIKKDGADNVLSFNTWLRWCAVITSVILYDHTACPLHLIPGFSNMIENNQPTENHIGNTEKSSKMFVTSILSSPQCDSQMLTLLTLATFTFHMTNHVKKSPTNDNNESFLQNCKQRQKIQQNWNTYYLSSSPSPLLHLLQYSINEWHNGSNTSQHSSSQLTNTTRCIYLIFSLIQRYLLKLDPLCVSITLKSPYSLQNRDDLTINNEADDELRKLAHSAGDIPWIMQLSQFPSIVDGINAYLNHTLPDFRAFGLIFAQFLSKVFPTETHNQPTTPPQLSIAPGIEEWDDVENIDDMIPFLAQNYPENGKKILKNQTVQKVDIEKYFVMKLYCGMMLLPCEQRLKFAPHGHVYIMAWNWYNTDLHGFIKLKNQETNHEYSLTSLNEFGLCQERHYIDMLSIAIPYNIPKTLSNSEKHQNHEDLMVLLQQDAKKIRDGEDVVQLSQMINIDNVENIQRQTQALDDDHDDDIITFPALTKQPLLGGIKLLNNDDNISHKNNTNTENKQESQKITELSQIKNDQTFNKPLISIEGEDDDHLKDQPKYDLTIVPSTTIITTTTATSSPKSNLHSNTIQYQTIDTHSDALQILAKSSNIHSTTNITAPLHLSQCIKTLQNTKSDALYLEKQQVLKHLTTLIKKSVFSLDFVPCCIDLYHIVSRSSVDHLTSSNLAPIRDEIMVTLITTCCEHLCPMLWHDLCDPQTPWQLRFDILSWVVQCGEVLMKGGSPDGLLIPSDITIITPHHDNDRNKRDTNDGKYANESIVKQTAQLLTVYSQTLQQQQYQQRQSLMQLTHRNDTKHNIIPHDDITLQPNPSNILIMNEDELLLSLEHNTNNNNNILTMANLNDSNVIMNVNTPIIPLFGLELLSQLPAADRQALLDVQFAAKSMMRIMPNVLESNQQKSNNHNNTINIDDSRTFNLFATDLGLEYFIKPLIIAITPKDLMIESKFNHNQEIFYPTSDNLGKNTTLFNTSMNSGDNNRIGITTDPLLLSKTLQTLSILITFLPQSITPISTLTTISSLLLPILQLTTKNSVITIRRTSLLCLISLFKILPCDLLIDHYAIQEWTIDIVDWAQYIIANSQEQNRGDNIVLYQHVAKNNNNNGVEKDEICLSLVNELLNLLYTKLDVGA